MGREQAASSESRRLDIQGLRAVAVILVVAFHAGLPVPGGFIGVDVFLVISGFVIMGMLMRELRRTGTIRFRVFYSRRIKRLLPALALLTTTIVLLSMLIGSSFGSQQTAAETGFGATFFSANLIIYRATGYFSPDAALNPLLHTWTLSAEEQVYLVFPALLLGGWIAGRWLLRASARGAAVMLTLVAALSFLLCLLLSIGRISIPGIGDGERFAFYSSISRIWEFAIGAALALGAPSLKRISPKVATVAGVAGACAIVVGTFTITGLTPYPGFAVLLPVLGAAAIITAGFHPTTRVPRLLATKPMTKVGDISYSLYLWHWPLIVFGAILWPESPWVLVILAALSFIPAWASTVILENPIRENQAIKGRRVVALAALCTVVPTVACSGLALGAHTSWGSEELADMRAQVVPGHIAYTDRCDVAGPLASETPFGIQSCAWNTFARGPHLYLVGDSIAAQYSEALIGASGEVGGPLTLRTADACFFVDTSVYVDGVSSSACSRYVAATVAWLAHREPGIVVLSSSWDVAIEAPFITMDGEADAVATAATSGQKHEVVVSSLTQIIHRLREAGHQVIIVLPSPHFAGDPRDADTFAESNQGVWRPSACPNVVALLNTRNCGAARREAEVDADQSDVDQALTTIAEMTDSTTLDLRPHYCSQGVCRTNAGNRWMFRDGYHITVAESEALTPTFVDLFAQAAQKT